MIANIQESMNKAMQTFVTCIQEDRLHQERLVEKVVRLHALVASKFHSQAMFLALHDRLLLMTTEV